MASDNVKCGQQQQSSSQVWEEIVTFPRRSVGINLPVNCFIFSSRSPDRFSILNTEIWLKSAGRRCCQSPFPYLSQSFVQIYLKSHKKSVPQDLIVIDVFTVPISGQHFQKKVLLKENCKLLDRNLSLQGTRYNCCVMCDLFISSCICFGFVVCFFFLPTLYTLDTSFFNKLMNREAVFLLCIAQQESHGPLIGTLVGRKIIWVCRRSWFHEIGSKNPIAHPPTRTKYRENFSLTMAWNMFRSSV